jgi:hypothetical protein
MNQAERVAEIFCNDGMNDRYRIESKENVNFNGIKSTLFSIFEKERNAYLHKGRYSVTKHNATDAECLQAYLNLTD